MIVEKTSQKDYNFRELYLKMYKDRSEADEKLMWNEITKEEYNGILDSLANQVKDAFRSNVINIPHYNKLMFTIYQNDSHKYGKGL